jgi:hypothetical protein
MEFTHRTHHPEVSISSSIGADFGMTRGEFHDQEDAKWIVIRGSYGVITIHPLGGQPPAGLSATQGLAALRVIFGGFSYY